MDYLAHNLHDLPEAPPKKTSRVKRAALEYLYSRPVINGGLPEEESKAVFG